MINLNQPQIIDEYAIPLSTEIELNRVFVDVYGQHHETGYECHCVAISGTRIDITEMLSAEQIDILENAMNNDLPTWQEVQFDAHMNRREEMLNDIRGAA